MILVKANTVNEPDPIREEELEGHLSAGASDAPRPSPGRRAPEANGAVPALFADDPQGARAYLVLGGQMRR